MTTRSGKELTGLEGLIDHYKHNFDGLPVLLTAGVTYWDPPSVSPVHKIGNEDLYGSLPSVFHKHKYNIKVFYFNYRVYFSWGAAGPVSAVADLKAIEIAPHSISMICQVGSGQFGQVF